MGLLHYFFLNEVYQGEDKVFIFYIKKKGYVECILKKNVMTSWKPLATPIIVNEKLEKKDGGKKK